jgi:hypothetical protein
MINNSKSRIEINVKGKEAEEGLRSTIGFGMELVY